MKDYTLENSIRMGMAGMVLLIPLIMLAEAWWNHKEAPQVEMREISARTL